MAYEPIAYTYEADYHCVSCTEDRFGPPDSHGEIHGIDREGNPINPIAEWDEFDVPLCCGTCGRILVTRDRDGVLIFFY